MMDVWGDHGLVCACGGDRTIRHNILRDLVVRFAKSAGHAAVAEKQGLLPPRPCIGAAWENGVGGIDIRWLRPQDRRPADVWFPAWNGGRPAAVDLAVTSGLQSALHALSAVDGGAAAERYAERKRRHLDTAAQCADAAFSFIPFVVEAESGLGREARGVLTALAHDSARFTGEAPSVRGERATQALSVALQRANALAIARRAPGHSPPLAAPLARAREQLRFAAADAQLSMYPIFPSSGAFAALAATVGTPAAAPAATASAAQCSPSAPSIPVSCSSVACGSLSCSPPALCATPVSGAAPAAAASPAAPPLLVGGTSSAPPPNDTSHLCSV